MKPHRLLLLTLVLVSLLITGTGASAQTTALTLSVPGFWRNFVNEDMLAQFEAENSGVKVYLKYNDEWQIPSEATGTDLLDAIQNYVSSADVLYVDYNSIPVESTVAGYYLDLSPLVDSDTTLNSEDFFPAVWQSFQWDNGIWALPTSTQVTVLTYDPIAFDAAGVAYPNASWKVDDIANAARALAKYDASGNVTTPGLMVVNIGNSPLGLLTRALVGHGIYDPTTIPNAPDFSDPLLANILTTGKALLDEGVLVTNFGDLFDQVPLRLEGDVRFRAFDNNQDAPEHVSVMLPNDTAGLTVSGFAVSGGTQNPELAYALAKFLTMQPEIANGVFSGSPARQSMVGVQAQPNGDGDGPGGGFFAGAERTPEMQAVIDQALQHGLPTSELRYSKYLEIAFEIMGSSGVDAQTALQEAEKQAYDTLQLATERKQNTTLYVTPPPELQPLSAGEIALDFALGSQFVRFGGGGLPNQAQWDQVIADFVASDPQVGRVTVEQMDGGNLTDLTENYDCFSLSYNAVSGNDLSSLLSLDPFIDTDTSLDKSDFLSGALAQVQQDNLIWAMPLAIQPNVLRYDSEIFAQAGVAEPINGWTTQEFISALQGLKNYLGETAPFVPQDPGGSYMMMLINAFGGLPIDYRTDPPTINFTDPATVDAIRQVLDLAKAGYIEYAELGTNRFVLEISDDQVIAITANAFSPFSLAEGSDGTNTSFIVPYPQGSTYQTASYTMTTAYISATAQNADACYHWISTIARHPELFEGMPVRRSLVSDPSVVATQGQGAAAVYAQLESTLADPNAIIIPSQFQGGGAAPTSFISEFWLKRAFDRYVNNDADLETELADAQTFTQGFLDCAATIPPISTLDDGQGQGGFRDYFEQFITCATNVDPTFGG